MRGLGDEGMRRLGEEGMRGWGGDWMQDWSLRWLMWKCVNTLKNYITDVKRQCRAPPPIISTATTFKGAECRHIGLHLSHKAAPHIPSQTCVGVHAMSDVPRRRDANTMGTRHPGLRAPFDTINIYDLSQHTVPISYKPKPGIYLSVYWHGTTLSMHTI